MATWPTRAGKSLLFMLPALLEPDGTTIVVVPRLSHRQDMKARCSDIGVRCVEWDCEVQPDGAAIVLVTPEECLTVRFKSYIDRLKTLHQLDRIVIDECNTLLKNQLEAEDWLQRERQRQRAQDEQPQEQQTPEQEAQREQARILKALLLKNKVQTVLLFGAMPAAMQLEVAQKIDPGMSILHMSAVRPNIRYSVVPKSTINEWYSAVGLDRDRAVADFVKHKSKQYQSGKVIVYCNTKSQAEKLATAVGARDLDSDTTEEDDLANEDSANRSSNIVFATTGSFSMRVKVPNVRCVIHTHSPRTLIEFAQESGRAGNHHEGGESILLGDATSLDSAPLMEISLFQGYMTAKCRRAFLHNYLDPVNDHLECGSDNVSRCDCCPTPAGRYTNRQSDRERVEEPAATVASLAIPVERYSNHPPSPGTDSDDDEMPVVAVERPPSKKRPISQIMDRSEEAVEGPPRQRIGIIVTTQPPARIPNDLAPKLDRLFDHWRNKCVFCCMNKLPNTHCMSDCPAVDPRVGEAVTVAKQMAKEIKCLPAPCYRCALSSIMGEPQGIICDCSLPVHYFVFGILYGGSEELKRAWMDHAEQSYGPLKETQRYKSFDETWLLDNLGKMVDANQPVNVLAYEFFWLNQRLTTHGNR
ncbi:P-loop containing nucleoside triphosphate hydrolase protein [Myxozyma melibiosi]|uniref:DNA 3'-5' helicase n=1 Tax=Myxozyma melibiosi TaxID=54550 RepID=A0ABR1EXV1_9ASCO